MTHATPLSTTLTATAAIIGMTIGASSATALPIDVTFGSNNDGFGGFTTSPTAETEVWSGEPESVKYAFGTPSGLGDATNDEAHTASLLRSVSLDRSDGRSYTIEGVVDFTSGYGDDNNRIGIILFNDTITQTADGGGGLFLRLNTDDNDDDVIIADGINGTELADKDASGTFSGDGWVGTTLTYKAEIEFTGGNIDVTFTFTDQDGVETSVNTVVAAANYTGTHFGFGTKIRFRDEDGSDRDVPPELNYQSFSIVPEPASLALMGLGGLMVLGRRRRRREVA